MTPEKVYGINPVREALRGDRKAFELFVQESATDQRIGKLAKLAEERGLAVRRRTREDLTRVSGSPHHQGVVLTVAPFIYADFDELLDNLTKTGTPLFLLALDGIQDPQNLGALIRSAACAGVQGIIIPKDRACGITAVAEKASAGAVETVPIAQLTNLARALEQLKEAGCWVYGLVAGNDTTIYNADFSGNLVLVVGSEGDGIRPLVRKQCDHQVSIPLYGGVSSLNASVAGAIAMFEAAKQRHE